MCQVISEGYPRGKKELLGALSRFGPTETADWFRREGVTLKTEADGRMFPITDDSQTVIDALGPASLFYMPPPSLLLPFLRACDVSLEGVCWNAKGKLTAGALAHFVGGRGTAEGAAARAGVIVQTLTRVDNLALAPGFTSLDPPRKVLSRCLP